MEDYTPSHIKKVYAPGKNYLLITGVLLIVFGVSGLVNGIVTIFLRDWIIEMVNETMQDTTESLGIDFSDSIASLVETQTQIGLQILGVIQSAIVLAVGIMGAMWREVIEKSKILFILGLVCIGVYIIPNIIRFEILAFSASLLSIIVPVMFVVGASKNKAEMEDN